MMTKGSLVINIGMVFEQELLHGLKEEFITELKLCKN